MESFSYKYPGVEPLRHRAHVGVVGSGDLEVILEPSETKGLFFAVRTSADGFRPTWEKVLEKFAQESRLAAVVTINDFGATPGVVRLRLAQALEVSNHSNE